jgi:hypothetical protein
MNFIFNISTLTIILLITIFSGISYPEEVVRVDIDSMSFVANKINQNVQLKENEWTKIVKDFYHEETIGEFNKKHGLKKMEGPINNELMRSVIVLVQFLKPCKATSKNDDLRSKYSDKSIPDYELGGMFSLENMTPRYKCDYRTKIFVTFYDKSGVELDTIGSQPMAPFGEDEKRKYEILPGEKVFDVFSVPSGAAYYYSWVPK